MSATYIQSNLSDFPVKKLETLIRENRFATLGTAGPLIYTATGTSTFFPVCIYLQAIKNTANFTFNRLFLCDRSSGAYTLSYGLLDVQLLNASSLLGGSVWTFNSALTATGVQGIRTVPNRDVYLRANADDLAGVGDWNLTIYYLDIPLP